MLDISVTAVFKRYSQTVDAANSVGREQEI